MYNKMDHLRQYGVSLSATEEEVLFSEVKKELEIFLKRFSLLITSEPNTYQNYLSSTQDIYGKESLSESLKCARLISKIFEISTCDRNIAPSLYKQGYPRFTMQIIGNALFPTAGIIINCALAHNAAIIITKNLCIQILFVIATTFVGGLIDYYTNNATYGRLFDSTYDAIQGSYYKNTLEQYHQNKYWSLMIIMVLSGIIAASTVMPSLYSTLEHTTTVNPHIILLFAILALTGQCVSKLYMSLDLVFCLLDFSVQNIESNETKTLKYHVRFLNETAVRVASCQTSDLKCVLGVLVEDDLSRNTILKNKNSIAFQKYIMFKTTDKIGSNHRNECTTLQETDNVELIENMEIQYFHLLNR